MRMSWDVIQTDGVEALANLRAWHVTFIFQESENQRGEEGRRSWRERVGKWSLSVYTVKEEEEKEIGFDSE